MNVWITEAEAAAYKIVRLPRPHFTFDKISLLSSVNPHSLRQLLPIKELRQLCHRGSFHIIPVKGHPTAYPAKIDFTYPASIRFWNLLLEHEPDLGVYKFGSIEMAYDFVAGDETTALDWAKFIAMHFRKLWQQQREVRFVYDEIHPAPMGIIHGPTFYFEGSRAATRTKVYARHSKTAYGLNVGRPVCRLEWTLANARTVRRTTRIETICDLMGFYTGPHLEKFFRLEAPNMHRLGRCLFPRAKDPRRAFELFLRTKAYEDPLFNEMRNWKLAHTRWHSAAQLRGWVRGERARLNKRRGRRSQWEERILKITDYKLHSFFDDITPVWN